MQGKKKGKATATRRKKERKGDGKDTPLLLKGEGEEYAHIMSLMGDRRMQAMCCDGKSRVCIVRGKMKKRVWVCVGDVVLISLRSFEDVKADIIHKYSGDHVRKLRANGLVKQMDESDDDDDSGVVFEAETITEMEISNI